MGCRHQTPSEFSRDGQEDQRINGLSAQESSNMKTQGSPYGLNRMSEPPAHRLSPRGGPFRKQNLKHAKMFCSTPGP
jgi:hypothetical protein